MQVPIPRAGSGVGAPRIRDLELVQMVAGLLLALDGKPQDDVDITTFGGRLAADATTERQATMTVVLVDPRRPSLVPVEAIELLGRRRAVHRGDAGQGAVVAAVGPAGPTTVSDAPVLLSSDPDHPAVQARLAAGDRLIAAPGPAAR